MSPVWSDACISQRLKLTGELNVLGTQMHPSTISKVVEKTFSHNRPRSEVPRQ